MIRPARREDLNRIAEIEVFNYRLQFYPIFKSDFFYFEALQVPSVAARYESALDCLYVYDDGVVKGFTMVQEGEIKKLFVEPVLQGQHIGGKLLEYALSHLNAATLWALEKNPRAIAFYRHHGFRVTRERKLEEGTDEYLVRLVR